MPPDTPSTSQTPGRYNLRNRPSSAAEPPNATNPTSTRSGRNASPSPTPSASAPRRRGRPRASVPNPTVDRPKSTASTQSRARRATAASSRVSRETASAVVDASPRTPSKQQELSINRSVLRSAAKKKRETTPSIGSSSAQPEARRLFHQPRDSVASDSTSVPPAFVPTLSNLDKWKKAHLVMECQRRSLPIHGTKPELAARILKHVADNPDKSLPTTMEENSHFHTRRQKAAIQRHTRARQAAISDTRSTRSKRLAINGPSAPPDRQSSRNLSHTKRATVISTRNSSKAKAPPSEKKLSARAEASETGHIAASSSAPSDVHMSPSRRGASSNVNADDAVSVAQQPTPSLSERVAQSSPSPMTVDPKTQPDTTNFSNNHPQLAPTNSQRPISADAKSVNTPMNVPDHTTRKDVTENNFDKRESILNKSVDGEQSSSSSADVPASADGPAKTRANARTHSPKPVLEAAPMLTDSLEEAKPKGEDGFQDKREDERSAHAEESRDTDELENAQPDHVRDEHQIDAEEITLPSVPREIEHVAEAESDRMIVISPEKKSQPEALEQTEPTPVTTTDVHVEMGSGKNDHMEVSAPQTADADNLASPQAPGGSAQKHSPEVHPHIETDAQESEYPDNAQPETPTLAMEKATRASVAEVVDNHLAMASPGGGNVTDDYNDKCKSPEEVPVDVDALIDDGPRSSQETPDSITVRKSSVDRVPSTSPNEKPAVSSKPFQRFTEKSDEPQSNDEKIALLDTGSNPFAPAEFSRMHGNALERMPSQRSTVGASLHHNVMTSALEGLPEVAAAPSHSLSFPNRKLPDNLSLEHQTSAAFTESPLPTPRSPRNNVESEEKTLHTPERESSDAEQAGSDDLEMVEFCYGNANDNEVAEAESDSEPENADEDFETNDESGVPKTVLGDATNTALDNALPLDEVDSPVKSPFSQVPVAKLREENVSPHEGDENFPGFLRRDKFTTTVASACDAADSMERETGGSDACGTAKTAGQAQLSPKTNAIVTDEDLRDNEVSVEDEFKKQQDQSLAGLPGHSQAVELSNSQNSNGKNEAVRVDEDAKEGAHDTFVQAPPRSSIDAIWDSSKNHSKNRQHAEENSDCIAQKQGGRRDMDLSKKHSFPRYKPPPLPTNNKRRKISTLPPTAEAAQSCTDQAFSGPLKSQKTGEQISKEPGTILQEARAVLKDICDPADVAASSKTPKNSVSGVIIRERPTETTNRVPSKSFSQTSTPHGDLLAPPPSPCPVPGILVGDESQMNVNSGIVKRSAPVQATTSMSWARGSVTDERGGAHLRDPQIELSVNDGNLGGTKVEKDGKQFVASSSRKRAVTDDTDLNAEEPTAKRQKLGPPALESVPNVTVADILGSLKSSQKPPYGAHSNPRTRRIEEKLRRIESGSLNMAAKFPSMIEKNTNSGDVYASMGEALSVRLNQKMKESALPKVIKRYGQLTSAERLEEKARIRTVGAQVSIARSSRNKNLIEIARRVRERRAKKGKKEPQAFDPDLDMMVNSGPDGTPKRRRVSFREPADDGGNGSAPTESTTRACRKSFRAPPSFD